MGFQMKSRNQVTWTGISSFINFVVTVYWKVFVFAVRVSHPVSFTTNGANVTRFSTQMLFQRELSSMLRRPVKKSLLAFQNCLQTTTDSVTPNFFSRLV